MTRRVHLSVHSRQAPMPQTFLGRNLAWWLTKTRLLETTVASRLDGDYAAATCSSARARAS